MERIHIKILSGDPAGAIALSQGMAENKTMPHKLIQDLPAHLTPDKELHQLERAELVDLMLANVAPSKKRQFLESL